MSDMPLHSQIRDSLQQRIVSGEWPAQFQLPSEPELARSFNVSRMTVRQAVQRLIERGFLYRRRGVGTFVAPVVLRRDLSKLTSFSEDAAARGMSAHSRVLKVGTTPADERVADRLQIDEGEPVVRIERLRSYGQIPAALQVVRIPERLCPEVADQKVASGSVYSYLEEERHFRLGWGVQNISARMPTRAERSRLQMPPSTALLVVERITFLDDGTPIELSDAVYRGDEQSFTLTMHR